MAPEVELEDAPSRKLARRDGESVVILSWHAHQQMFAQIEEEERRADEEEAGRLATPDVPDTKEEDGAALQGEFVDKGE